jgi:hypothetical protein
MLVRRACIIAFLIFGLSGGADASQEGKDMKLEDMGFVMRAADTPAQIERLRQLPPRTFVTRSKNGRRYYLYADPDYCKCVFVGDETAMRNYRDNGVAAAASADGDRPRQAVRRQRDDPGDGSGARRDDLRRRHSGFLSGCFLQGCIA